MSHTGIRLRITTDMGRLFEADSDRMHLMAKFGESAGHTACLPGCDAHGWSEVLRYVSRTGDTLLIESLPVTLADDYPDDDECEDSGEDQVHPYVD